MVSVESFGVEVEGTQFEIGGEIDPERIVVGQVAPEARARGDASLPSVTSTASGRCRLSRVVGTAKAAGDCASS